MKTVPETLLDIPPEIFPDGFTGAICAIEGIKDAAVLLNGPTGCKFFHGAVSENQYPRTDSMNPLKFSEEFYFGQPRLPATYLDDHDYIFGATGKLEKILPFVAKKGHSLIALINSPGASLIGDDLKRFIKYAKLETPCIAIENCGFSEPFAKGFENALIEAIKTINPVVFNKNCNTRQNKYLEYRKSDDYHESGKNGEKEKKVNLIGFSIFQKFWEKNISILKQLLKLCGISVNCVLCCKCSIKEIKNLGRADMNIAVHSELAQEITPFLKENFGLETILPEKGAPIGFEATKSWISSVCNALDANPGPAFDSLQRDHEKIKITLGKFYSLTGLPRGLRFAISANGSIALALTTWLYKYLGMIPIYVNVNESTPKDRKNLKEFLKSIECIDAWQKKDTHIMPDIAFGSEAFISGLRLGNPDIAGVNIAFPGDGYMDILPKGFAGGEGALWLVEKILNGLDR